jgi:hypothetical protein
MNRILCDNGCGKEATYTTKGGKHQCAPHHRSCPAVLKKGFLTNMEKYGGKTPANSVKVREKMAATSIERYGVANASSSTAIKEKRKQVMLERYGVENPSHINEVKETISTKLTQRWKDIRKNKVYNNDGLTYEQYRHRVQQYSDTQYNLHNTKLDPEGLRSKHYHLDHIYSVSDAWLNEVPVNVVGDISNLRMISDKENYSKHRNSHKSLTQLYEDFAKSI